MNSAALRMGRIGYLNVLPIYHPLEAGILPHNFEIVSGPPALLNDMMARGELHVSSCSCFEYACRPDRYYLVNDLAIGSRGPVMSVLLLSHLPVEHLDGREILISGETHTSVALLRLLMRFRYHLDVTFSTGSVAQALRSAEPPVAFLAIGDEALRLRNHPDYPCRVDMAEAWREWTDLPFIFGLWVISRDAVEKKLFADDPGALLRRARDWGMAHMDVILNLTGYGCPLSREELLVYYRNGLVYSLGEEEQQGLRLFYDKLAQAGMIPSAPGLRFYS
ncbi:chorismate dehydratase [Candidatus Desulfovibrio trichonymphae]|uniref:Chorismate dehydratase n=2 Tax=Candidatus Desulfovibrio trichonymphae TaxID=1725232 RepID=A0A1J1DUP6_9BACT|nr:chorismate dehydratase [Candidatus Desulfovibrio trichonymphae]GHU90374.1 chorismate dehydratase [Deltaproteobacteria bacterium]GHU97590.1 chorismate dehydratase [Deltaproteobacteria bacterium]